MTGKLAISTFKHSTGYWCLFCLLFPLCICSHLTVLSSIILIWAAGARCKWRAHLHSRVLWQRFGSQTFQSLGKHSTNELPCHLDVVKFWILIGQSQSVILKEKKVCLLITDDWQVVVNSGSSQWIHSMIGQLHMLSFILALDIIIYVGYWSINPQLHTKIFWLHLIFVNLKD